MILGTRKHPVIMEEVTDPDEIAKADRQRERFDRNIEWYKLHTNEVYRSEHGGKYVCIAGQEFFVSESANDAVAMARAAHPEDNGLFVRYVSKLRGPRIYAF